MGHSLCSFILRQIPRRSPTHNAVYFTTTRLGGYSCQYKSSDELPLILNVQEVSNFLGLGLSQVYELVKRIDFPAFKVGSRIFVPKDKFLTWLNVQTEEKDSLFYTE